MKTFLSFFTLYFFILFCLSGFSQKNIHMRWGQMLGKYVSDSGKVNYLAWQNESAELDAYLEGLANMPPRENWPLPQKLAYWINAYNALTIQLILKNYPIRSIRDIKKPWSRIVFKTNDKSYSLHFIEHEILRKLGEPRIHFAINCASISCPKLQNKPFVGNQLTDQLEAATSSFILDETKNNFNYEIPKVSRIFLWFGKDFGTKLERKAFLEKYSGKNLHSEKLDYLDYEWGLNE